MFLLPKSHATQEQLFGRVKQQVIHKCIHCFKTRDPLPKAPDKGKRGKILIKKKGKEIKTLSLSLCAKSKEAFPMQTTLLPDSTTTEPGLTANLKITILISVV